MKNIRKKIVRTVVPVKVYDADTESIKNGHITIDGNLLGSNRLESLVKREAKKNDVFIVSIGNDIVTEEHVYTIPYDVFIENSTMIK